VVVVEIPLWESAMAAYQLATEAIENVGIFLFILNK